MRRLVHLWTELQITRVLGFGARQLGGLPRLLLGGGDDGHGHLRRDADGRARAARDQLARARAHAPEEAAPRAHRLDHRGLRRAAPSSSCRPAPDVDIPPTRRRARCSAPTTSARTTRSRARRSRCSSRRCGSTTSSISTAGLRQNTPIAPALRLGATHVFAIGSSREVKGVVANEGRSRLARAPGAAFLLGKVLNAFLLDHVDVDLELLAPAQQRDQGRHERRTARASSSRCRARRSGATSRRIATSSRSTIRPSEDLGRLASEHVRQRQAHRQPVPHEAALHAPRHRRGRRGRPRELPALRRALLPPAHRDGPRRRARAPRRDPRVLRRRRRRRRRHARVRGLRHLGQAVPHFSEPRNLMKSPCSWLSRCSRSARGAIRRICRTRAPQRHRWPRSVPARRRLGRPPMPAPVAAVKVEIPEVRVKSDATTTVRIHWVTPSGTEVNDDAPFRVRWNRSDGLSPRRTT